MWHCLLTYVALSDYVGGSVGNITVYIPQPALGRRVQGLVLLYNQCYVCYVNGLHTEVTLALWLVDPITLLGRLSTPLLLTTGL